MRLYGIDEAALGSKLGPICVCRTEFQLKDNLSRNLYTVLKRVISQVPDNTERLQVGDSKILYSSRKGTGTLRRAVMVFLQALGHPVPSTLFDVLTLLVPPMDTVELRRAPWFAHDIRLDGNVSEHHRDNWKRTADMLNAEAGRTGVRLYLPVMRCLSARQFNSLLEQCGGKGTAVLNLVGSLLKDTAREFRNRGTRVVVDRQGGRKFYSAWLDGCYPGESVQIVSETSGESVYRLRNGTVHCSVQADRTYCETALASMFAKYVRELLMSVFNMWWRSQVPGLRPTAGYPGDAERFVRDIHNAGAMLVNDDELVRRK